MNTEQRITYIDRPKGSPKADLFRCSLCWENPHTLLIGWADMVKIAIIKVSYELFWYRTFIAHDSYADCQERGDHMPTVAPSRFVEIVEEYAPCGYRFLAPAS